jgi:hypothetical protein
MNTWTCEILTASSNTLRDRIFTPESSVVEAKGFTVGQKLQLQCKGEVVSNYQGIWVSSNAVPPTDAKKDPTPAYYIGTPNFIDETTLNIQVAAYKVGEQQAKILLTKDAEQITLETATFTVASVLEQHDYPVPTPVPKEGQQQQQGPQPYPFAGPSKLEYPMLLWILLLLGLILVVTYAIRKWIRYYNLKRWLEEQQQRQLATTPEKFFYKEVRALQREKTTGIDGYNKLQDAYYTFLEHRFKYPVRKRGINDSTFYILKHHSLPKNAMLHLKRNLLELKKVGANAQALSGQDLEKLSDTLRKNVDEFQDLFKGKPT